MLFIYVLNIYDRISVHDYRYVFTRFVFNQTKVRFNRLKT